MTDLLTWPPDARHRLTILTGGIGAGKTSACLRLIETARAQGAQVAGVVSPGVYEAGGRVAIDVWLLHTDVRRRLATRRPLPDASSPTPGWQFDDDALTWANAQLAHVPPCDLLLIDEIGPLELLHGGGFTNALALLDQANSTAVVVVRPALVERALARWRGASVVFPEQIHP